MKKTEQFVVFGRFGAPHGVRGALLADLSSRNPAFIAGQDSWWCQKPPAAPGHAERDWLSVNVTSCEPYGKRWLVFLQDVGDREQAAAWCHARIALPRDALPALAADGEVYWHDLIGARVSNREGYFFGEVIGLLETGAHDVLEIRDAASKTTTLIPYQDSYILDTDIADKKIRVDWQPDW